MTELILGGNVVFSLILLLVINYHTKKLVQVEECLNAMRQALGVSLQSQRMLTNVVQQAVEGGDITARQDSEKFN